MNNKSIWEQANEERQEAEEGRSEEAKANELAQKYLSTGNSAGKQELTREKAIAYATLALQRAQEWMRGEVHKDGKPHDIVACSFIFGKYGDVAPFPVVFDSIEEKHVIFDAMAKTVNTGYKRGVIKAYMVLMDAQEGLQEGLVLLLTMPNEKLWAVICKYGRDAKGLPVFEPIKAEEQDTFESALVPSDIWDENYGA